MWQMLIIIATSGFLTVLECTIMRFRPGLRRGPHWGSLQRSPEPLAYLKGSTSKGERGGRENGREGKERERPAPPFTNFGIRAWLLKTWPSFSLERASMQGFQKSLPVFASHGSSEPHIDGPACTARPDTLLLRRLLSLLIQHCV